VHWRRYWGHRCSAWALGLDPAQPDLHRARLGALEFQRRSAHPQMEQPRCVRFDSSVSWVDWTGWRYRLGDGEPSFCLRDASTTRCNRADCGAQLAANDAAKPTSWKSLTAIQDSGGDHEHVRCIARSVLARPARTIRSSGQRDQAGRRRMAQNTSWAGSGHSNSSGAHASIDVSTG
jgi:hypothetical protein